MSKPQPKTPSQVLIRAADLIETHGLVKGKYQNSAGNLNVSAAIALALHNKCDYRSLFGPKAMLVTRILVDKVAPNILADVRLNYLTPQVYQLRTREDPKRTRDLLYRLALYRWSDSFEGESELESGRQVALKLRLVAQHPSFKFTPLNRAQKEIPNA